MPILWSCAALVCLGVASLTPPAVAQQLVEPPLASSPQYYVADEQVPVATAEMLPNFGLEQ